MNTSSGARTKPKFTCCQCGRLMNKRNSANTCIECLRSGVVDITSHIPKRVSVFYCPRCDTYKHPPSWTDTKLGANELLWFFVKNLPGLSDFRVLHAELIWATEPQTNKIKLVLAVQKENIFGTTLEQACAVDYAVCEEMCGPCLRAHVDPNEWLGQLKLRALFDLEPLIGDHDAVKLAVRIERAEQGIDLFFDKQSDVHEFIIHLSKLALIRIVKDKRFVTTHADMRIYKFAVTAEVSPICRDDLIRLPPEVADSLGYLGPFVICNEVSSNGLSLFDPVKLRGGTLDVEEYWRLPFEAALSSDELVEFVVLDVEVVFYIRGSKKFVGDVRVARVSDYGKNETVFEVRTHLGHVFRKGDYALGYDLVGAGIVDTAFDGFEDVVAPDVVLLRKSNRERDKSQESENHDDSSHQ